MRTVKSGIKAIKFLGKDYDIPIVRLCDKRNPFYPTEVLRLGQGNPHSISRVCAIGNDVLPVDPGHAWVFHAELFISSERSVPVGSQKGPWISGEAEPVGTACQANDGPSGAEVRTEKHDVFVPVLHDRCVVNGFHWVGDFGLSEDGVVAVPPDNVRLHNRLFASRSKIVE
jgi:hypothetical protein